MPSLPFQAPSALQAERLLLAAEEASLPRSALYPAPEHYTEAYSALQHQHALGNRHTGGALRPLALQLQVPFCSTLCHHCSRTTIITQDPLEVRRYLAHLEVEMALTARHVAAPTPLVQWHLGGGAPSQLSLAQLDGLLEATARHFVMGADLAPSLEADPRHLSAGRLKAWHGLGYRGLYVALPDSAATVQAALGRAPLRNSPERGLKTARDAGFRDVRVELILGLPHQTLKGVENLLEALLRAEPDVLRLTPYWHLPHRHPAQRNLDPASLSEPGTLLAHARELLVASGRAHIGLDRFVTPASRLWRASQEGHLRLDSLDYQHLPEADRLGLGLGALSRLGRHHAQNTRNLDDYAAALEYGLLPVARGCSMDADDWARHAIMQSLFCRGEVDFHVLAEDHLIDFKRHFPKEWRQLEAFSRQGWIWLERDGFGASAKGRYQLPRIAAIFDRYGRHARQLLNPDVL